MENTHSEKPATKDVEFTVEELQSPEPRVYGFRLDLDPYQPDDYRPLWVDFTSLEITGSNGGGEPQELLKPGMSLRVLRGGQSRIEYGSQINERELGIALIASLTNPKTLEFASAIYTQPTDVGDYRLNRVRGRIHYSLFEN